MTILSDAFRLCRRIKDSPSTRELRAVIEDINYFDFAHLKNENNRSFLGNLARQQGCQFLGYLLVDQHRDEIAKRGFPWPISGLSDRERELMLTIHGEIVDLNKRCSVGLVNALPEYRRVIDPYSKFEKFTFTGTSDAAFLDNSDASVLAATFNQHAAIVVALSTQQSVQFTRNPEEASAMVARFADSIVEVGVSSAPSDLNDMIRNEPQDSPLLTIMRHLGALVGIRDSMANLNQLIYQAVLDDSLPQLDENNVYDMQNYGHLVGSGASVAFQPSEDIGFLEPMRLLRMKLTHSFSEPPPLYRVETLAVSDSMEIGETAQAELRGVDDDLNSFGGFLRLPGIIA